jgi:hypothetical protein
VRVGEMISLAETAVADWCGKRGIQLRPGPPGTELCFPGTNHCLIVRVPESGLRCVALAYLLLMASARMEESEFKECLLWLRDWEIGSPELDRAGHTVLRWLRLASTEPISWHDAPGELFGPEEVGEAHAAFVQPLIFDWDAYLVPSSAEYFVFSWHHEQLFVVSPTKSKLDEIGRSLQGGGWPPEVAHWPIP